MKDRRGERYGRLVIKRFVRTAPGWNYFWECECDCGKSVTVSLSNLLGGSTKSCGCLRRDQNVKRWTKHGQAKTGRATRLYRTWSHMRLRCNSPKNQDYRYYGARGIRVCDEWNEYAAFEAWALANGYRKDLTIERIDNDGDYTPDNCAWVPRSVQARNRRNNRRLDHDGRSLTIAEWAEVLGISAANIRNRLHMGWDVHRALTTPVQKKGASR